MAVREYVRLCKQAGCGEEFTVSAPSIESDRVIGLSEPEYCPRHRALHAKSYSRIACHHYDVEMTAEGELLTRRIERQKVEESSLFCGTSGRVFYPWAMPDEGFGPGGLGCFERPLRGMVEGKGFEPQAKVFQIADKMDEILEALQDHQVVVLVGTTGSGKSTYVPWHLLTGGVPGGLSKWARRGPICVTQPRIQATRQVPRFIANALNGTALGVGSQIGFSHSRSDEYDRRTRLIFKTDGKLINDIVSGAVGNYSIVMIDEAHERSKNIDLILGLLKDQLYLYPHLRVIIASATIDQESFINFFGGPGSVPYVYSEGRRFPIAEHWWGDPKDLWWKQVNHGQLPERDQLPYAITELTRNLCESLDKLPPLEKEQRDGHILVFLPGADEIDKTVGLINSSGLPNVISLPLYARRPLDEQEAALNPTRKAHPQVYGKRRVVVSTNVAETSLTVEGVKFVIDSGFIKESYWNPVTEVSEMRTVRHSRAGCRQRWGRAGRVSPGDAYMLYTRELFEDSFPKDSTPEIARSSLEEIVLTAKAAGVRTARGQNPGGVLDFDWMPLSRREDSERFRSELRRAYKSLVRQKALDEDGDLTTFGLELRGTPASLEVTRIFTEGERHAMGIEVATLLPFLKLEYGVQTILRWEQTWDTYHKLDVRRQQSDFAYGCRDDLELYLKLWVLWEGLTPKERQVWEEEAGVSYRNFQEKIDEERKKLLESVMDRRKAEQRHVSIEKIDALRALIAFCMRGEIYVPIEDAAEEEASPIDRRLRSSAALGWESYWEDAGLYEESDEELVIDPVYSAEASERSGVYRRLESPREETDESALIELAPTSVSCGRADANVLVACQRRANFRRPARARVVGMNVVRLEPEWLTSIRGTLVQRAKLFAALSRLRAKAEHERLKVRLFLPWLVPRGTVVKGEVKEWSSDRGARFELAIPLDSEKQVVKLHRKMLRVEGWLPPEEIGQGDQPPAGGTDTRLQVVDYSLTQVGAPMLVLGKRRGSNRSAFQSFAKRHPKGSTVNVEMRQVLEDPLGRSPVFIVRETTHGIDIPMADTDFCGGARAQSYFGRRFGVGDRFEVEVDEVAPDSEMIFLTRGRQLLREYAGIPYQNFTCIDVTVVRVDRAGAYLAVNPAGYVGFARRALWPVGFDPEVGAKVRARIRRLDRHVDVKRVEEQLKDGEPMPSELNLGVELDLLIPPAYERFCGTHGVGDVITVTAEKPLDNGGLLVALNSELKGIIFRTELDLDDEGRLKRARDYEPGSPHAARIFRMEDGKATVNCSLFRKVPPPEGIAPGQTVDVRVLDSRGDSRDSNRLWLTCSLGGRHQVQVWASAEALEEPPRVGDQIQALVSKVDRGPALVQATYVGPAGDSAGGV